MVNRQKNKKKFADIIEYYNYKIKNKVFQKLKTAILISQQTSGLKIRKKLMRFILFKNIKELWEYKNKKFNFYRRLHLKKHYIKKWKFLIFMIKNFKIAELKFISKFILNWRRALVIKKEKRINSVLKLSNVFETVMQRNVILNIKK